MASLKCKKKLHCSWRQNSNKKSFDLQMSQKIAQSDSKKGKVSTPITIHRSLIRTLEHMVNGKFN